MLVSDLYCPSCRNAKDHKPQDNEVCWSCVAMGGAGNYKESKTNADRIRAMTDEELKEWFCNAHPNTCSGCPFDGIECTMLDWLKKEASDGNA